MIETTGLVKLGNYGTPETSLEKISAAKRMLQEASSLEDILIVNSLAESAIAFAKAAHLGTEAQNLAAELAIRAKRKAGGVLLQLEREPGKRTDLTSSNIGRGYDAQYTATLEASGTTRQKAHVWQTLAAMDAPVFEQFIADKREAVEEITTAAVYREARRAAAQNKPDAPRMPSNKYRVIYADPPWKYGDSLVEGYGPASVHYPSQSIDELCAMAVKDIVEDDAVLFLWVTSPLLDESMAVIEAWGFAYKTSFVWDKVRHNYGHYNSVRHEFLLVCTRGSCLPECKELHDSVIEIERSSTHSEKPEYFRQLIDKLYRHGARLELFARGGAVPNWDRWGNEFTPG